MIYESNFSFNSRIWFYLYKYIRQKNDSWSDISQDSIQIKSPVDFIDSYGRYTVIGVNKKIKLVDFGDIEKNKKRI